MTKVPKRKLERADDDKVDQHGDAERQDEERQFLHFHRVFARRGIGRHDEASFAQGRRVGNGSGVAGTGVTYLKFGRLFSGRNLLDMAAEEQISPFRCASRRNDKGFLTRTNLQRTSR